MDALSTFAWYLFHSEKINCHSNFNYALVGAMKETKRRCGASGDFSNVPNVDEDIESCQALVIGDERTSCWVALDSTLMEEVVPWVPYLWQNIIRVVGPAVTKYEFDQFTNEIAFAHMAVHPSKQK